ncbi:RHS repeat-associated core domain-containing protein [Psychromonas aquimarina]|uniref:RHS repeat-associated core domain-containing protein n=1 Tax=Psychromonas aquimarina TaxID=444919 RepID=UPI000401F4A9|nr:RHS repeat-associated core domain-containing protein [Psychromonas aquimarina]
MNRIKTVLPIGLSALGLVTSLGLSAQTEDTTASLVPIMMGDITIFVPLAAEVTPDPTPDPDPETPDPVDPPIIAEGETGTGYKYDNPFGLVSEIDGPRSDAQDITSFTYQDNTGYLETVTNALQQTVNYADYNSHGLPETIVDINGYPTTLTYTDEGWLKSSEKGGLTTSYEYDNLGQVRFVTSPGNNPTEFIYNDARYLRFIKYANGVQKEMQYDKMGNVKVVLITAQGKTTVASNYDYDELGRLTDVIYTNSKTLHKYDLNSNPEFQTNGYNVTSKKVYDNLNRLEKYIDELENVIDYTYNAQDQLTTVSDDNGGQTVYGYDGLGRLETLTSPDTGITTYKYDDAGNPTYIHDARGQGVVQQYDALNRLTEKQYEGARDEDVVFTYDEGNNAKGKLSSISTGSASVGYGYDALGRLTDQTNTLYTENSGELSGAVGYGYDAVLGSLDSITYPSGMSVSYHTNSYGEVTSISLSGGEFNGQSIASNISYNVVGNIENLTYGNDVTLTRVFDADGQPKSQSVSGIWDLTYSYDDNRNLSDIISSLNSADTLGFKYYHNNRLRTATDSTDTTTFEYDGVGNRTTQSNQSIDDSYLYVLQSNLLEKVNAERVEYDEVGNTITSPLRNHTYSYNAEGRLSTMTSADAQAKYFYNGLSERVIKQVGDDTYLYFYNTAGQLLETQHYQGATKVSSKQIIWLGSLPLAQVETGSDTAARIIYIHADHLNTPRKATDSNGQLVWQWQSDAFGKGLPDEDVNQDETLTQIDLRFPGQIYDAESGLYYNYYRYYDPQLGRYITSDPIGLNGGINTFAYVGGNPVGLIDPNGHSAFSLIAKAQNKVRKVNMKLAGGVHPKTGVPFTAKGFPDFSKYAIESKTIKMTGNRKTDERLANAAAGLDKTPSGFTWHHVEDTMTMQLIPKSIHNKTAHTGGVAVLAVMSSLASSAANASPGDYAKFAWDILNPFDLWIGSTEEGAGSLYGPGTPYSTYDDYNKAMNDCNN